MSRYPYLQFVSCWEDAVPELPTEYRKNNIAWLEDYIRKYVPDVKFRIASLLPSLSITCQIPKFSSPDKWSRELICPIQLPNEAEARAFRDRIDPYTWRSGSTWEEGRPFVSVSTDMPISAADHWCPISVSQPTFGDSGAALQLIHADSLPADLDGAGVNVVIVDRGLNAGMMAAMGADYRDGWEVAGRAPGTAKPDGHGTMIARNVLAQAPRAAFYDLPLLPERIGSVEPFLSVAVPALTCALETIRTNSGGAGAGPWIFVNAWSVLNTSFEFPRGDYTNNPANCFNKLMQNVVAEGHDIIFAASNCGEFCPSHRCGRNDRGPGRSILGANALPDVLTVGGVRVDRKWLGYSSQGPGPSNMAHHKPDICAPSHFREDHDTRASNTGTSAACAVAAGTVAALRTRFTATGDDPIAPAALIQVLKDTATKRDVPRLDLRSGLGWDERFGFGVLDVARAYEELVRMSEGTQQRALQS